MTHVADEEKLLVARDRYEGKDLRALLFMSDSTAPADPGAQHVGDLATLDEYDGSGYSRQALSGEAFQLITQTAYVDHADVQFGATVAAGTRPIAGLLIYEHVTNDADSPIVFMEDTFTGPTNGDGGALTFSFAANGWLGVQ